MLRRPVVEGKDAGGWVVVGGEQEGEPAPLYTAHKRRPLPHVRREWPGGPGSGSTHARCLEAVVNAEVKD